MPLRIYTGILGQIGDVVMFTATARRLKELLPNAEISFAVSERYRQAGELVAGLPYVDRLFVADLYFEKLTGDLHAPWEAGWPVDLRGAGEVEEERRHDVVLETRPRHRRERWWERAHQVAETAAMVGVPGPIDLRTEIAIPPGTAVPAEAVGKIVFHNEPAIDPRKAWPWPLAAEFVGYFEPGTVVLLGSAPASPNPECRACAPRAGGTEWSNGGREVWRRGPCRRDACAPRKPRHSTLNPEL